MVIDDELFELRNQLLKEAMQEVGIEPELQEIWLRIDEAFRKVIVKSSSEAKKRFFTDEILDFTKKKGAAWKLTASINLIDLLVQRTKIVSPTNEKKTTGEEINNGCDELAHEKSMHSKQPEESQ